MNTRIACVFTILAFLSVPNALGANEPSLLIVADFAHDGISDLDMRLLVDLFSYTLFETGKYNVMNRYERNKLIRGFGYNEKKLGELATYIEAAELLGARYIVTGRCGRAGDELSLSLVLRDVRTGEALAETTGSAAGFAELVSASRKITFALTGTSPLEIPVSDVPSGLSETLLVSRFLKRVLVVLPEAPLDIETASALFLVNEAATYLSASRKVSLSFSSAAYDPLGTDAAMFRNAVRKRDAHSVAFIRRDGASYSLVVVDERGSKEVELPFVIDRGKGTTASGLAERFERELPLLTPARLVRELEREIKIKEKIDTILFNEKFLSQKLFIGIHQNIFTPSIAGKYHPLLNLVSIEGDVIWYHSDLFGIGAGYAFSLSYPGTIDSELAGHPLVARQEIRLFPVSFRSPGRVGVLLNVYASLLFQNAYQIEYFQFEDKFEYTNETTMTIVKIGFDLGLLFNINDDVSFYLDLVDPSMVFPIDADDVTYDGSNISGGAGGIGIILRF